MPSEALKQEVASLPQAKWMAYRQERNGFRILREETLWAMTVMELVNGPYVVRFDLPRDGKVYFIGLDDELYRKLTEEGKKVRWLHEFFQGIQDKLKGQGLPEAASIYRWSLGRVRSTQAGLEVFQGAKVEDSRTNQYHKPEGSK